MAVKIKTQWVVTPGKQTNVADWMHTNFLSCFQHEQEYFFLSVLW
jgi:hypothetical protein